MEKPAKNGRNALRTSGTLQPLYVIDNVVRSGDDFNALDVSEEDQIPVLKDAAAAFV
ncbi:MULTISPECIES: hypothetical protein [unclassified Spirosoma]|uniref:hypothetical protein n=1 Tax=unclassified Spirosoma TaxID=2621999 RepID=UPI000AFF46AD|nr:MULTISPECIES: hypothetical protein [unclassified Spirosoma]MBN8822679.1 hypothetical protein [Spirosoma sp.]